MPVIAPTTVTLTMPGATTPAIVREWTVGEGERPGRAVLEFPTAATGASIPDLANNVSVQIHHDGELVFLGHTVQSVQQLGGRGHSVVVVALDVRHAMTAKRLGQYGIGPVATTGGWIQYGYSLVFNEDGRPNRSVSHSTATDGNPVFLFDTSASAEYWTFAQILEFIFGWYIDSGYLRLPSAGLPSVFDSIAPEMRMSIGTARDAVARVMKTLGARWTVEYDTGSGAAVFRPIIKATAPATTRTIVVDSPNTAYTPTKWNATNLEVIHSTQNNFDRAEIHSPARVIETNYQSGTGELLTRVTSADDLPADCAAYFSVDVTKYAAKGLGSNLIAGDRPKPWLSKLVTRRTSNGYVAAGASLTSGEDVPCRECVWLSRDGGSTYKLLRGGYKVDLERMRLYIDWDISEHGATVGAAADNTTLSPGDVSSLEVEFTVATQCELPFSTGRYSDYLAIHRTRMIERRDLVPTQRINSMLPDPYTANNPHATTLFAVGSAVTYDDPSAIMTTLKERLWDARDAAEAQVSFTLPFMPQLGLGDGILITPAQFGLPGDMRVTRLGFDGVDMTTQVTATNNFDGV